MRRYLNLVLVALIIILLIVIEGQCTGRRADQAGVRVRVSSDLPGAVLYIDGREMGSLPGQYYMPEGSYQFHITPSQDWAPYVAPMDKLIIVTGITDVEVIFLNPDRQLNLGPGSNALWTSGGILWLARPQGIARINSKTWVIEEFPLDMDVLWLWADSTKAWLGTGQGWYIFDPGAGLSPLGYRTIFADRHSRWPTAVDMSGNIRVLSGREGPIFEAAGQVLSARVNSTGTHLLYMEDYAGTLRLILTNIATGGKRIVSSGESLAAPEFSPDGNYLSWLSGDTRIFAPLAGSFENWPGQEIAGAGKALLWLVLDSSDLTVPSWRGYALFTSQTAVSAVFDGEVSSKPYTGSPPMEWQQVGNRVFALMPGEGDLGTLYFWADSVTGDVTAGIEPRSVQSRARGVVAGKWSGSPCGKMLSYTYLGEGGYQVMLYILPAGD